MGLFTIYCPPKVSAHLTSRHLLSSEKSNNYTIYKDVNYSQVNHLNVSHTWTLVFRQHIVNNLCYWTTPLIRSSAIEITVQSKFLYLPCICLGSLDSPQTPSLQPSLRADQLHREKSQLYRADCWSDPLVRILLFLLSTEKIEIFYLLAVTMDSLQELRLVKC